MAREALVCSAPRCRADELAAPYLRRCISGALQHHLRDRVRLVRIPHRLHEQRCWPLSHLSLDASADGEPCLLDQLAALEDEPAIGEAVNGLPLRLNVLEWLSLRAPAKRLKISAIWVQRAQN